MRTRTSWARRLTAVGTATLVGAGLLAANVAPTSAAVGGRSMHSISVTSFGMHSPNRMPTKITRGTLRLVGGGAPSRDGQNFYMGWADLEPARGVYNWKALDAALNAATLWGYTDISYSVTRIPVWAADRSIGQTPVTTTGWDDARVTASLPNRTMYAEFADALAKHLAARPVTWPYFANAISIEPMNEAGSAGWMRFGVPDRPGRKWTETQMKITADYMGSLTTIMSAAMGRHKVPNVKVLAGSTVLGGAGRGYGQPANSSGDADAARITYWLRYLNYLKTNRTQFYGFALHHYSKNAVARDQVMSWTRSTMAQVDPSGALAAKPRWDTEFNLGGSSDAAGGSYTDAGGAAQMVQAYTMGFAQGYSRQYWYKFNGRFDPFTGVQMGAVGIDADSPVKNPNANANIAWNNMTAYFDGATPVSCTMNFGGAAAAGCKFTSTKHVKGFYVIWSKTTAVTGVSLARETRNWDVYPIIRNGGPTAVTNGAIWFGPEPILVVAK